MPLYFYFNAAIVKFVSIFTSTETDLLIIWGSKFIDSISLPLLVIPLFLIIDKLSKNKISLFEEVVLVAFAVLSTSPLILTSDLQKNTFAVPLMFFFVYYLISYLSQKKAKDLSFSILFLILTGLTHFGVFAVSLLFLFIAIVLFYRKKAIFSLSVIFVSSLVLIILISNSGNKLRMSLSGIIAVIVFTSLAFGLINIKQPVISTEAYVDLSVLKSKINEPEKTIIIAPHGIEWWVGWQVKTKIGNPGAVNVKLPEMYKNVIFLETIQNDNRIIQPRTGKTFPNPIIPDPNRLIYSSAYFNAYEWIKK